MAKATLKFDLSDPYEQADHLRCIKSLDLMLALWEISSAKKRIIDLVENKKLDKYKTVELVFDEIQNIINNYKIDLEELNK